MNNKQLYSIVVILGVLVVGTLLTFDQNGDFDYCEDQPLFGLKYQYCDTIECVNFHEDIKQTIKEENCN